MRDSGPLAKGSEAPENPPMRPLPVALVPVALVLALGLGLTSCVWITTSNKVTLSTNPPGARVLVDGEATGFTTPVNLSLERESHRLSFELTGYETAFRQVEPNSRWNVIPWSDGDLHFNHWRFPLWLTWMEFLFPFRYLRTFYPSRVHVHLDVAAEG